nr:hypothetical protein Iba_chr10bCG5450 [Ipomoea batatas]
MEKRPVLAAFNPVNGRPSLSTRDGDSISSPMETGDGDHDCSGRPVWPLSSQLEKERLPSLSRFWETVNKTKKPSPSTRDGDSFPCIRLMEKPSLSTRDGDSFSVDGTGDGDQIVLIGFSFGTLFHDISEDFLHCKALALEPFSMTSPKTSFVVQNPLTRERPVWPLSPVNETKKPLSRQLEKETQPLDWRKTSLAAFSRQRNEEAISVD